MSNPGASDTLVVVAPIALSLLQTMASDGFGDFVKGVVDVERRIMAVGGDLHSDGESALLESGSHQPYLWGINLFPGQYGEDGWIEYDSLINIRPARGNRSRGVEDPGVRRVVIEIVGRLVDVNG